MKKVLLSLLPIFILIALPIPYMWLQQDVLSKIFGCGCSEHSFNANTFTIIFWYLIAVVNTILAITISKKVMKNKIALRFIYILIIAAISFVSAYFLIYFMKLK